MSQIKLKLATSYSFSMAMQVRYGDVNSGMHLGYDNLVSLLQEARIAFFKGLEFDELNQPELGFLIADLAVEYKSEAHFGDHLVFQLALLNMRSKSVDMQYKISNQRTGKDVAVAKTGLIFFDKNLKEAAPIPDDLRSRMTVSKVSM